jgi:hypothetical protein
VDRAIAGIARDLAATVAVIERRIERSATDEIAPAAAASLIKDVLRLASRIVVTTDIGSTPLIPRFLPRFRLSLS